MSAFTLSLIHLAIASLGLVGLIGRQRGSWATTIIIIGIWLAALALLIQTRRTGEFPQFLRKARLRPFSIRLLLAVMIALIVLICLAVPVSQLPAPGWFVLFLLLYPWTFIALLVFGSDSDQQRLRTTFANGLLLFVSIGFSLGVLEFLLRQLPNRLPRDVLQPAPSAIFNLSPDRFYPYVYQLQDGNKVVETTWSELDGSLTQISCFNFAPDFEPDVIHLNYARDPYGFRNATPWAEDVHLIVLGDSFTDATFIPTPYWDGLTDDQLILAYPGTGTIEQGFIYQTYGVAHSPNVVLLTFFEGNDAVDNNLRAAQLKANAAGQYSLLDLSLTMQLVRSGIKNLYFKTLASERVSDCPYPVTDSYGHGVGLYPPFFGSLALDIETLRGSGVFDATQAAIIDLAARVADSSATFVVVYMPSKEHVHWNGLQAAGVVDQFVGGPDIADRITANQNAQSDLLAALATEHDFLYLDLTPTFIEATAAGQYLYCYTDDHLCQPGHDLTREIIRDFFRTNDILP